SLGVVDKPGAIFLAAIAAVGLMSAWLSPSYLVTIERGFFRAERARRWYYLAFFLFWAALLAVPLSANLTSAWLLIEATTGAPAAGGGARRVAGQDGAAACDRRSRRSTRLHRLRARVARGCRSLPLASACLETAARVLEPRAHGRTCARDRLRQQARARRCR